MKEDRNGLMPKCKLILSPTSGAPGFNVKNVFCLPGQSILKSMLEDQE